ncbi:hypothetical protein GH733_008932 [Mirounga leonina]|nr:hypothetical protein GH733_008932 [Mirounga leonina]
MEWANDGKSEGGIHRLALSPLLLLPRRRLVKRALSSSDGCVLAHLERLEIQVKRSRKNVEDPQRAQAVESALGTKIHKLRCLRDELRAEVKQHQARVRLSGKLTSRGVCVCISTAFEGNLLDSYFIDLVIQKPLRIHHHSIPVFIPLEEISAKYLQTNIQHFLFCLSFLAGPLRRNSLCNLLSFTYKVEPRGQSFPFCARLLYKDLTTALPTDVTVTYQGMDALSPAWEEQRASHENLFFSKPLHQVFTSFARKGEKLDMSLVS